MTDTYDPDLPFETLIHDLNNVFETITEAADLLATDRQWQELSETLRRSVTRGRRLVGALPEWSDGLNAILEDAIQSVTDYCTAARKSNLRFACEHIVDVRLPGPAKDWERVFVNLFLNAAQVMKRGGTIEISSNVIQRQLHIQIADDGPGIPANILPDIFHPNVSTKTNASTRTGLGLHIVESIIRKYGGSVTAANQEKSSGAIFSITLPIE